MKNKIKILPLFAALVFLLPYFIGISRMPDPILDNLVPFIITGLSFCGAALFVISMKPVSERWYLGIFHVAMIGIVCVIILCRFFSLAHNIDYLIVSLAFLPLTSIGFFMIFPEPGREGIRLFILVSGVIGLYAVFLVSWIILGLIYPQQTSWSVIDGLSAIYLLLLLPFVGICHISAALKERSSSGPGDSSS